MSGDGLRPPAGATPAAGELPPADEIQPPPLQAPRYLLALVLLAVTVLTTSTLGAIWWVVGRTDLVTSLPLWLGRSTIAGVWGDRELLASGLMFALPLVLILLSHEMGHYLWCRHYRLPATAPLFLPAPFGFGTLGAFIRIRAPLGDRRQLLDVGAGGPIAGFVVLLPFLFYGIAHSAPAAIQPVEPAAATSLLYRPGGSLLMELVVRLYHGPLPADTVLNLHPFALAAWAGLLATSINLLPVGQLDGGHILYAAAGKRQRPVATVLWILMAAAGFLWPGWWLLALLVLIFGLRHPPVVDESVELDAGRRGVAWLSLAILVLSFMPAPVEVFFLDS